MELRLLLSDKIPKVVSVISHFLYKKPELGKIAHVEVEPEEEFVLPKLLREDITMGVFETESKSLGRKVIVKVKPYSDFRKEIRYSVYATSVGDFSSLPHFVRVLEVIKDDPPIFLVKNLKLMKTSLEKAERKA